MSKKKSPRYPSMDLEEALSRALSLYKANHLHPVANDVAAQSIGYSNAKNGSAMSALASLKYFGLVERTGNGQIAASKEVEHYQFAPNADDRAKLLNKWLRTPAVFQQLLEKYQGHLPSDAAIKFELIQMGFIPATADTCLQTFKKSVDFAGGLVEISINHSNDDLSTEPEQQEVSPKEDAVETELSAPAPAPAPTLTSSPAQPILETDRIPVRLRNGRKAWLEIPTPFYKNDKEQLKRQIDLLLADDEDGLP